MRARRAASPYQANPPRVAPMRVRPVFDSRPFRNRGQPGIARELDWPNDRLLVSTLVHYGQPQWSAEQIRFHPPARWAAVKFYLDVLDAAEGDRQAAERVDYCRAMWQQLRADELIADVPNRTVGLPE